MKILEYQKDFIITPCAETEIVEGELLAHRFPMKVLNKMNPPHMATIADMNGGVEIQLYGEIDQIEISLRVLDSDGFGLTAEYMYGDRKLLPRWVLDGNDKKLQTKKIDIPHDVDRENPLRFLYPTHSKIQINEIKVNKEAVISQNKWMYNRLKPPLRWVIHGDSITQGANVSCPSNTFVEICARELGLCPINLGIGGYGCAELEIAEYLSSIENVDILSLHIGTNCISKREDLSSFRKRLKKYLEIILKAHSDIPVVLATPIYRNLGGNEPKSISQPYREVMNETAHELRNDFNNLYLIDGLSLISSDKGMMGDYLHLADESAVYYANNLKQLMTKILDRYSK